MRNMCAESCTDRAARPAGDSESVAAAYACVAARWAAAPHLLDQRVRLEQRLVRVHEVQDGVERCRGGLFDGQRSLGGPIR